MSQVTGTYRDRIYGVYASRVQHVAKKFDPAAAERWGRTYSTYLKGWLPDTVDAEILDAACGGGRFLYFLQGQGYQRVTGVDLSGEQVALARQVRADVVQADAL